MRFFAQLNRFVGQPTGNIVTRGLLKEYWSSMRRLQRGSLRAGEGGTIRNFAVKGIRLKGPVREEKAKGAKEGA